MKRKWFYPIQDKVKIYLEETYRATSLQFQDVTPDRVYENYFVVKKDGSMSTLLIVMHKTNSLYLTYERDN